MMVEILLFTQQFGSVQRPVRPAFAIPRGNVSAGGLQADVSVRSTLSFLTPHTLIAIIE
jgi:hypothetical protein